MSWMVGKWKNYIAIAIDLKMAKFEGVGLLFCGFTVLGLVCLQQVDVEPTLIVNCTVVLDHANNLCTWLRTSSIVKTGRGGEVT